ncbi:hypothetical protein [Streptomyces sp. NBC_00503]|uniref:hypothetical protein n=1 Tax=Streptomyces sp. NBC_00503 TaxID=2903659 RepID=UPI002E802E35|nr:hypothetical protein [Streptomyces sp. NBC_00503]WUD79549.1 hypothetical protein OG490_02590 [Streptomyces sp. NBC_00503]
MEWWQAGLWGALGALLVEVADLVQSLQEKKKLPWRIRGGPSRGLYYLAVALRTALGIGVAVVLGTAGQVSGGFGAVLAGIAAPRVIERLRNQAIPGHSPEQGQPLAVPRAQDGSALPQPVRGDGP